MDSRINDIGPSGIESRVMAEYAPKESRVVTPVQEAEGGSFNKTNNDSSDQQKESPSVISREQAKELAQSAQGFLNDLNVGVTFEIHGKAGDLIVKVINRDTKEVIRQIPAESLVKLHDSLKDLVGVLFSGKA